MLGASDTARAQLRDALLAHIRQSKAATAHQQQQAWHPPADARPYPDSPKLLVGDHRALMESLRTFTGTCGLVARQVSTPPPPEKGLEWLAAPVSFSASDHDRALTLLRLRHAGFDSLHDHDQRSAAFDLARDLPFYDAALTAFYMRPLAPALEYELRVGHSVMRLLAPSASYAACPPPASSHAACPPPASSYTDYLSYDYPNWRDHTGLLHVLAVIAPTTPGLEPLAKTLPLARSHAAAAKSVAAFLQSSSSSLDPATSLDIDAAAVVMRVKSNPCPGASYSLDAAAREFASTCRIDADTLPALWTGVKSSLERALPPSALLLPAVW